MFTNLSPYLSEASYIRTGPWTLDPGDRPAEYHPDGPMGIWALYHREPGIVSYWPAWLILEEADSGPVETTWVPAAPRSAAAERAKRNSRKTQPRPCGKGKSWTRETPLREALAYC